MHPRSLVTAFASTLALLCACSSGNKSSPESPPPAPAPLGAFSASLTFDADAQRFNATWDAPPGVDHYRVSVKRTSADVFETLTDSLPASTLAYSFAAGFDVEWMAAALRVEACTTSNCTAARDLPLLPYQASAVAQKRYQKSALPRSEDFFGFSIATSADGTTLAVGLPKSDDADTLETDTGSVQVFVQAGTTWSLQATLTAPNMRSGDQFGFAVALAADGNMLAVSAPYESGDRTSTAENPNAAAPRAGAVYVFTRDGQGIWDRHAAYLKASNAEGATADEPDGGDQFGLALDLTADGFALVVGAWNEDGDFNSHLDASPGSADTSNNAAHEAGAAYVFTRTGAKSWAQEAYLKASNAGAGDQFGSAVAISSNGSVVAVGAFHEDGGATDDGTPAHDHNGGEESGAAYVFARNGTTWTQQAYLKAAHGANLDWFGYNLSLSQHGDLLAVGAPFERRRDGIKGGVVHVYSHTGSGWTLQSDLESAETFPGAALFGTAMDFDGSGKTLVVSAVDADITRGQAYLFARVGDEWRQQSTFAAGNPDVGDQFGLSIALSADAHRLFIGAAGEAGDATSTAGNPNNGAPAAGAVYVY